MKYKFIWLADYLESLWSSLLLYGVGSEDENGAIQKHNSFSFTVI